MTHSLVGRLGINQGTSFHPPYLPHYRRITSRFGHSLSTGAIAYPQPVNNGDGMCDSLGLRLPVDVKMLAIFAKAFKACDINSTSSFIILYINIYFDWISAAYVSASLEKTA
jgi:hypothetical protein